MADDGQRDMHDNTRHARTFTLSVPPEEHWTLHHVLLDRIEQETTADDPTSVDPPPIEVFQAFETLDAGEISFTVAQLEAIQQTLAEYHHATTWETERPRLERLLHRVVELTGRQQAALPAE